MSVLSTVLGAPSGLWLSALLQSAREFAAVTLPTVTLAGHTALAIDDGLDKCAGTVDRRGGSPFSIVLILATLAIVHSGASVGMVELGASAHPAGSKPAELQLIVQRAMDESHWQTVSGPMRGRISFDSAPPTSGTARYRLLYRAANGAIGPASDTVEVALP